MTLRWRWLFLVCTFIAILPVQRVFSQSIAPRAIPESIHDLAVDFRRSHEPAEGETEIVSGRLYYLGSTERLLVHVLHPLEQILEIEEGHLRIFYPESGESFDILTDAQESLPFFMFFAGAQNGDANLSATGYTIGRHESRGDTLLTYWDPPRLLRAKLGQAELASLRGDTQWLDLKNRRGQVISRYTSSDWEEHSGHRFPSRVMIEVFRGSRKGREVIDYAVPVLNEPPPDWVSAFQLPEDAVVKDLR